MIRKIFKVRILKTGERCQGCDPMTIQEGSRTEGTPLNTNAIDGDLSCLCLSKPLFLRSLRYAPHRRNRAAFFLGSGKARNAASPCEAQEQQHISNRSFSKQTSGNQNGPKKAPTHPGVWGVIVRAQRTGMGYAALSSMM